MTESFKLYACRIMLLALETPQERATIFCEWRAHCEFLRVTVHLGGWKRDREPELNFECRSNETDADTFMEYHAEPIDVYAKIQALLA
jgi:hypothetical protein